MQITGVSALWSWPELDNRQRNLLMRFTLATVLLAFAVWQMLLPDEFVKYVPSFVLSFTSMVPPEGLVTGHGLFLAANSIWLCTGKHPRIAAAVSVLLLGLIIVDLVLAGGLQFIGLILRNYGLWQGLGLTLVLDPTEPITLASIFRSRDRSAEESINVETEVVKE